MKTTLNLFKREFLGYFRSPVAYVYLVAFILASMTLALFKGKFMETNDASLLTLFEYQPIIFLVFIPAIGMRLWSEEKRSGTWELLFTLPVTTVQAVMGKFLAAWAFILVAIVLTGTMVLTISSLGSPDWGPVFTGYIGLFLMAGCCLSIASLASALTKNQVVSFVLSVVFTTILYMLGMNHFYNLLEQGISGGFAEAISQFSFVTHFNQFKIGVMALQNFLYFLSLGAFCLIANVVILER